MDSDGLGSKCKLEFPEENKTGVMKNTNIEPVWLLMQRNSKFLGDDAIWSRACVIPFDPKWSKI
jgi:hypothetical protein